MEHDDNIVTSDVPGSRWRSSWFLSAWVKSMCLEFEDGSEFASTANVVVIESKTDRVGSGNQTLHFEQL